MGGRVSREEIDTLISDAEQYRARQREMLRKLEDLEVRIRSIEAARIKKPARRTSRKKRRRRVTVKG